MLSLVRFLLGMAATIIAIDVISTPLTSRPEPFFDLVTDGGGARTAIYFLLAGAFGLAFFGGIGLFILKFLFEVAKGIVESIIPKSISKFSSPIVLAIALIPFVSWKENVKYYGVSAALQVSQVLTVSNEFDVKMQVKPDETVIACKMGLKNGKECERSS